MRVLQKKPGMLSLIGKYRPSSYCHTMSYWHHYLSLADGPGRSSTESSGPATKAVIAIIFKGGTGEDPITASILSGE
jgi:hypothetical protein